MKMKFSVHYEALDEIFTRIKRGDGLLDDVMHIAIELARTRIIKWLLRKYYKSYESFTRLRENTSRMGQISSKICVLLYERNYMERNTLLQNLANNGSIQALRHYLVGEQIFKCNIININVNNFSLLKLVEPYCKKSGIFAQIAVFAKSQESLTWLQKFSEDEEVFKCIMLRTIFDHAVDGCIFVLNWLKSKNFNFGVLRDIDRLIRLDMIVILRWYITTFNIKIIYIRARVSPLVIKMLTELNVRFVYVCHE